MVGVGSWWSVVGGRWSDLLRSLFALIFFGSPRSIQGGKFYKRILLGDIIPL